MSATSAPTNLTLIPGTNPTSGSLTSTSPAPTQASAEPALRLITRRPKKDDQVDQDTGKQVTIRLEGTDDYQLDGDVIGKCSSLVAQIQPGALTICVLPASDQQDHVLG